MRHFQHPSNLPAALYCTLCGQEIVLGDECWACNGSLVCSDCLPDLARQELAPCHETHGKERIP